MLMKTKILHYLLSSALFITSIMASEDLGNQDSLRPNPQHTVVSEQEEEISSFADVIAAPAAQNQEEEVSAFAVDEEPAPAEQRRLDNNPSAQGDEGVTQINTSSTAQLNEQVGVRTKGVISGYLLVNILESLNNGKLLSLKYFSQNERVGGFIKMMSSKRFSKDFLHSDIQEALFPDGKMNLTINEFEYIHSYYQKYTNDRKSVKEALAAIRKITSITLTDGKHTGEKEGLEKISKIIKLIQSYPNLNTIVLEGFLQTSLDIDIIKDLVKKERLQNIKCRFFEERHHTLQLREDRSNITTPPTKIHNEYDKQMLTFTSESFKKIPNEAKRSINYLTLINTDKTRGLNLFQFCGFSNLIELKLIDFKAFTTSVPGDGDNKFTFVRNIVQDTRDWYGANNLFSGVCPRRHLDVEFVYSDVEVHSFKEGGLSLIKLR